MKYLTGLLVGLYIIGSLSCGTGAKINCCAKEKSSPVQSCHSSPKSSKSSPVNSFDLCCCSISAELPKSLENPKVNQVSFFSFLSLTMGDILGSNIKPIFASSSLSPPDEIFKQSFFRCVFPSHAPPVLA